MIEFEPGKRAVGVKKVTANEEFFNGHFPSGPIMPGVLQVGAMAQVPARACRERCDRVLFEDVSLQAQRSRSSVGPCQEKAWPKDVLDDLSGA